MGSKTSAQEDERGQQVMLYVIGTCQDLKTKGLLDGGFNLSPEGYQEYQQLKESGFRPTEDEMQATMVFLQSGQAGTVFDSEEQINER